MEVGYTELKFSDNIILNKGHTGCKCAKTLGKCREFVGREGNYKLQISATYADNMPVFACVEASFFEFSDAVENSVWLFLSFTIYNAVLL